MPASATQSGGFITTAIIFCLKFGDTLSAKSSLAFEHNTGLFGKR
jgi:hypothetical protein